MRIGKIEEWWRKLKEWWPLLLAVPMIFPLNVDFVIIPNLRLTSMNESAQFLIAVTLAVGELIFWFIFWRWVAGKVKKSLIEDGAFVKKVGDETGFIDLLRNYFLAKYQRYTEPNNRFLKLIRSGSRLTIFLLAAFIPVGTRVAGTIVCGAFNAKKTFFWVCVGDIIHTAIFFYGWKAIFAIFKATLSI